MHVSREGSRGQITRHPHRRGQLKKGGRGGVFAKNNRGPGRYAAREEFLYKTRLSDIVHNREHTDQDLSAKDVELQQGYDEARHTSTFVLGRNISISTGLKKKSGL